MATTNLGNESMQLGRLFAVLAAHGVVLLGELDYLANTAGGQVQLPLLGNAIVVLGDVDHQTVLIQLLDVWFAGQVRGFGGQEPKRLVGTPLPEGVRYFSSWKYISAASIAACRVVMGSLLSRAS